MKYLIVAMLLTSCVSTKKQMDSTLGQQGYYLIEHMGNPQRKESNGRGGEIWIYSRYNEAMLSTGQTLASYRYYIFYLDQNNRVYRWRTDLQPVPIQQLNVNMYIR